ncbi:ATP-binding protein [Nocardia fluminea]|uniref:Putative HTH transcriptional regulator n=1 Tax=Nocardia fluminea TaxID=134984 RepID=A0A2N3V9L5_9NOCA|nr:RNA-binding domain-containing protein [Nocardia fluminea]PKV78293.1 putative HTH transcriptional regulator [Nocardia fluminea]
MTPDVSRLVGQLASQPSEAEWLEFKQNLSDGEQIGQYISALSNAAALNEVPRAYLVWGVEDGTHAIVGTTFDLHTAKKGNQSLDLWIRGGLNPDPGVSYYTGEVEGKRVGVLEIQPACHYPTQFSGTAYIRIGSHKKKLNEHPAEAKRLYQVLESKPFEARTAAEGLMEDDVLTLLDHEVYFRLQKRPVPADQSQIMFALETDRIVTQDLPGSYSITNVGALLFAKHLSAFPSLARKAPRVIKYRGKSKVFGEREQLGVRGYACGFEGLVKYIDNLLPRNEVIKQALREEVSMFPEVAVREVIANALIHQDFSVSGTGPLVELYDDRLEITNPGVPLIDPTRFIDAPPRSRNEQLARMMRQCHLCEERGSGWDRIAFEIESFQLPAPEVRVTEGHTVVTMFGPRPVKDMSREERIWATYFHACLKSVQNERLTNTSLRARFGLSDRNVSTVTAYIREAVDAGLIVQFDPTAGRKNMQYVPWWAATSAG